MHLLITGVTGYNVYVNGVLNTVTTLNTVVGSLTAATSYTFTVRAKMQQEIYLQRNSLTVVTNSNNSN
jgi:hypothetical protein